MRPGRVKQELLYLARIKWLQLRRSILLELGCKKINDEMEHQLYRNKLVMALAGKTQMYGAGVQSEEFQEHKLENRKC
jgi:hypothetical protein